MAVINPTQRAQNRNAKSIVGHPHPFLKWAGGKRQLLSQLDLFLPPRFHTYIEPFVGGGAMFFYLLPEKAILIDNNPELINVYEVIRDNVQELIHSLQNHRNESDYFYSIRNIDRQTDFANLNKVEKASRTIYLNRCCYNGLYRVNSKGGFNVPFGKYKNPKFCDAENLEAVHQALRNIEIILGSFELCVKYAKAGDFVYFDPPYVPLSKTANFTSYTKDNFGEGDQQRLKEIIDELTQNKVKIMLSNSDSEFIRDLYKDYSIQTVQATRAINSDASKRGAISEVVILNYAN